MMFLFVASCIENPMFIGFFPGANDHVKLAGVDAHQKPFRFP